MLMELWNRRREDVAKTGEIALARAKEAGVTAYYMDRSIRNAIIAHHPDGTREIIELPEASISSVTDKPNR